jgi:hypothetical protein
MSVKGAWRLAAREVETLDPYVLRAVPGERAIS